MRGLAEEVARDVLNCGESPPRFPRTSRISPRASERSPIAWSLFHAQKASREGVRVGTQGAHDERAEILHLTDRVRSHSLLPRLSQGECRDTRVALVYSRNCIHTKFGAQRPASSPHVSYSGARLRRLRTRHPASAAQRCDPDVPGARMLAACPLPSECDSPRWPTRSEASWSGLHLSRHRRQNIRRATRIRLAPLHRPTQAKAPYSG